MDKKMKKVSKALVLALVAVLMLDILCGCASFTKVTDTYREQKAIQVGEETITIGKLIDTFNNYYNTYSSYVSAGYVTTDYLLQLAVSSLYTQYMKVDAYKQSDAGKAAAQNSTISDTMGLANAEYLTQDELDFAVKYVKYLLFTTIDEIVDNYIEVYGFELEDEEEEDTSRDFVEYDDLGDMSYSEYVYQQNFENEDMSDYLDKYYPNLKATLTVDESEYVLSEDIAAVRVGELNDRLADDSTEQITVADYIQWQKDALVIYKKSVKQNYEYDIVQLLKIQSEDMILSLLVEKYEYNIYSEIDSESGLSATLSALQSEYEKLKENQTAEFKIDNDFVSFIEDLSDDSYILDVPDGYDYIFVKNILIPFTDEQTTILSSLEDQLGSTDNEKYIAARNEIAASIVAEDYTQQDENGDNIKVSGLFALDENGEVVINSSGLFAAYFGEDGFVIKGSDDASADETIINLMKKYNTDTAQHSTIYDYVVRVGDIPDGYSSPWETNFTNAAIAAYDLTEDHQAGTYQIAVTSYGVHIVYYSAKVEAQVLTFTADSIKDTTSPAYRMFKSYFEDQQSTLVDEAVEALQKEYYTSKIKKLAGLDTFLNDNGFTFDFESSIETDDD